MKSSELQEKLLLVGPSLKAPQICRILSPQVQYQLTEGKVKQFQTKISKNVSKKVIYYPIKLSCLNIGLFCTEQRQKIEIA